MVKYKIVHIGVQYDYTEFLCREKCCADRDYKYCLDLHQQLHGIKKVVYRVHNSEKIARIIKLPYKNIWAKYVISNEVKTNLKPEDYICFIYQGGDSYLNISAFDYLRNKYPNCILVYAFNDLASLMESLYPGFLEKIQDVFDIIITYNERDSIDRGFTLSPPAIYDYSTIGNIDSISECDVFYIGREKGRLNEIINVFEVCEKNGLKCDFYILDVPDYRQVYSDRIHYNIRLKYVEMLAHVKKAKSVLNIVQEGASGITLRDYECIGMNKVLITNNYYIKNTKFYNPEKIVFINHLNDQIYKINKDTSSDWPGKDYYSIENYFLWFNRLLNNYRRREI